MQGRGSRVVSERDPVAVHLCKRVIDNGGLLVAPTDTIYGVVADATSSSAVFRLRALRRPSGRPFIVLLPDPSWIGKLGLVYNRTALMLSMVKGITLVLERRSGIYHFLGAQTLAVRIPREGFIYRLLRKVSKPLVAPSANPEGYPPARTVRDAFDYFGDRVDLYVDGGIIDGKPSAILSLVGSEPEVLRSGPYSLQSLKRMLLKYQKNG